MDVLTSETCWAVNNEIIRQVTSSWSLFLQLSRSYEVCCLYGFFVCHILSYSFGSILFINVYICGCMFLFNFVNYFFYYIFVFLLLCVFLSVFCPIVSFCVLSVCKCVLYYCHRVSTQAQLTEYLHHVLSSALYVFRPKVIQPSS